MNNDISYAEAGVNLDDADKVKREIARLVKSTFTEGVLTEIGSFGGMFALPGGDVLVSSTDGVGTKLVVATMADRYDTIGMDLVNHCVNDIAVMGAEPLFFLDYIGYSDLSPEKIAEIVKGLVDGCSTNNTALIGGETAQMPDLYPSGAFDLVGLIVGRVWKNDIIDGSKITAGDILIGLPSTGLHTNGYSLARKVLFEKMGFSLNYELNGAPLGAHLLRIHRSYLDAIRAIRRFAKGFAHITGGGVVGNLIRILPDGVRTEVERSAVPSQPIFEFIESGGVERDEMWRVFNMGVGLIAVVDENDSSAALESLREAGEKPFTLGQVTSGKREVVLL